MIAVREWFSGRVFRLVHGHNLVYNACWEDPRLDRVALGLRPRDRLVTITSAGCNALDYALLGLERVDAVDVNPRQNALLELKIAAVRRLEFEDFFALFGRGRLPNVRPIYEGQLRQALSPWSQKYWDRWIKPNWFAAVEQTRRLLRPGGLIGVVDFYISRKHPPPGCCRHGWWTRTFWPAWFARDNVFLSADHVPFLHHHFVPVHFQEHRARLPYVPLLRVPYYTFAGRSRQTRTTRLDLLGPWPHSSG